MFSFLLNPGKIAPVVAGWKAECKQKLYFVFVGSQIRTLERGLVILKVFGVFRTYFNYV